MNTPLPKCILKSYDKMSNLLQDDLPDDVAQSRSVQGIGDAAQIEVDVRSGQEVDLGPR
jgi:hypothetical protein